MGRIGQSPDHAAKRWGAINPYTSMAALPVQTLRWGLSDEASSLVMPSALCWLQTAPADQPINAAPRSP